MSSSSQNREVLDTGLWSLRLWILEARKVDYGQLWERLDGQGSDKRRHVQVRLRLRGEGLQIVKREGALCHLVHE